MKGLNGSFVDGSTIRVKKAEPPKPATKPEISS